MCVCVWGEVCVGRVVVGVGERVFESLGVSMRYVEVTGCGVGWLSG